MINMNINEDYERGFADGYLAADRKTIFPFLFFEDAGYDCAYLEGYFAGLNNEKIDEDMINSAIAYSREYIRSETNDYYDIYDEGYRQAITDISHNLKDMKNIGWAQKKYLDLIQNSLISSFSVNDIEIPTDKIKNVATTFAYIFELNYKYSKYEKELKLLNSHKKEKKLLF